MAQEELTLEQSSNEQKALQMGVYAYWEAKKNACRYYRIEVPFRGLHELDLASIVLDDGSSMEKKYCLEFMATSDVVLWFAQGGKEIDSINNTLRNIPIGAKEHPKTGEQIMILPPSIVFDIDDNLDYVDPFNPVFVKLGYRNFDGEPLSKGDGLSVTYPNGTRETLWEDGITQHDGMVFDIARNRSMIHSVRDTALSCDGITVPCKYLADYYKETHGYDKEIYVFPNSIIPEDYPDVDMKENPDEIRVLWQGGASHFRDWGPLKGAITEIAKKYPHVKFIVWGQIFKWIYADLPEKNVEYISWMPYEAYKVRRMTINADINLCPLVDNIFNRSKSAIKWYESVIPKRPEVTLAAKVGPYGEEIVDGESGLLYETPQEFVEKLSVLIENATLRKRLAENARTWVMENRHYKKTVPGLFEYYKMLRARKKVALEV